MQWKLEFYENGILSTFLIPVGWLKKIVWSSFETVYLAGVNESPTCHQGKNMMLEISSPKWARTFSIKTISYTGPQIWNLIPERLRTLARLNNCKTEINKTQVKNRISPKCFVTDCLQKPAFDSNSPQNPF